MPCPCGSKVDRQELHKLQCILCKDFYHCKCLNVLDEEVEFIKIGFKCPRCLEARRNSLDVGSAVAATKTQSVPELTEESAKVSAKVSLDKSSFDCLMSEISILKSSNSSLVSLVTSLVAKVTDLEAAVNSLKADRDSLSVSSPKRKKKNSHVVVSPAPIGSPASSATLATTSAVSAAGRDNRSFASILSSSSEFPQLSAVKSSANWTEVRNRKKKKAPVVVGDNKNCELGVFVQKKWLHLSSFKSTVTSAEVSAYLAKTLDIDDKDLSCFPLLKKDAKVDELKFVNFKVGIPEVLFDKVFNSNLWPSNIKVRPFLFQPKPQKLPEASPLVQEKPTA